MAPNLLWAADLTYINLIRRDRPGLARDHTCARALSASARVLRAAQKRGPQTRPSRRRTIAYNNALRETSIRTSSIIQAVAQPVSPPDLGVADPPPQHLYSRRWHAAQRPYHTGGRTGPPHGAHPTHEFSRHQGNLLRGSRKTAGRKVLVNFPSGHAMSSRRLFLSGLLSSRARLRFAGLTILPNPKCSALPTTRFANPRHRKTIGTSTQLLAQ
jgi:hypothetical protein